MFFDPQTHTSRGVPFAAVVDGLTAAIAEAEVTLGMSAALIMCFLRHLPPDDAMDTLEAALPHADRILGIGLDSSEVGFPPSLFSEVYRRAVAEGFLPVAHAGEEGPPEYVWQAIDTLGVRRVDHGVRSMEDPALVRRLAHDGIPVTLCPLSNVRLRVVDRLADHVLPDMLDAGLVVSINSDDPAYFGGYVGDNYAAVEDELAVEPPRPGRGGAAVLPLVVPPRRPNHRADRRGRRRPRRLSRLPRTCRSWHIAPIWQAPHRSPAQGPHLKRS